MIELACDCGHVDSTPESSAGGSWTCPQCGRSIQLACAEQLPENAGQGDFDAGFTIIDGPDRVGQKILLGGVASIEMGKLQGKHILLTGNRVSRNHCKLNRVDFGPSRWEVEDTGATNGTFINGQKITKHELSPGDTLQVGDFQLQFALAEAPAEAVVDLPAAEAQETAAAAPAFAPPPPSAARSGSSRSTAATAYSPGAGPTLAYQSAAAEAEGPLPLGECDIDWVMKLRNASTLMCWTVVIKYILFKFGISFIMRFVPHSYEVRDIVISLMMLAAIWLLTTKEPGVSGDVFGVRLLLRIFGMVGYTGDIVLSIASMTESDVVGPISLLFALAQIPAVALLLFYMRRLSLRIPNQALAFSLMLLMIAMPIFVTMGLWAGYQALQGGTGQAVGFGLTAIIGVLVCEICRLGCLVWFNKSFS